MRFTVPLPMLPAHHYVPMAKAAEAAGFDSIAVPDSVFFPETVSGDYPFTDDGERWWAPDTPFVDPFVAIPAMAAVTERITFLTNVREAPAPQPAARGQAGGVDRRPVAATGSASASACRGCPRSSRGRART